MASGHLEKTWDQRILEAVPSGVDASLLEENLRLTPTQRVEQMIALLKALEEIERSQNGHGIQEPA